MLQIFAVCILCFPSRRMKRLDGLRFGTGVPHINILV